MKKFLLGVLIGIGLAVFGILFSGCNHRSKNKAAIFYITQDPLWEEVEDMDTTPTPPTVVDITNEITIVCDCNSFPPGHSMGHHDNNGHSDDNDCGEGEED